MENVPVPDSAKQYSPKAKVVTIGPPVGVSEEDCYSVEALVDNVKGGIFDGTPAMRVYFQFDEVEIEQLKEGFCVEFTIFSSQMPVFSVQVL